MLEARAANGAGGADTRLVSTYFDTPDRALARQGRTLRVRRRGRLFTQTVKSQERATAGLVRGEWEDTVASGDPEPSAPETGRFIAPDVARRLVPLFRTEVARQTIELAPSPGTRIEAAIDRGRIRALSRTGREPISEVELELKGGSAAALYDVAIDLLGVAPVRLERRSKAERGYRLAEAGPAQPSADHAAAVELEATLSGTEALRRIGLACLDQLMRNEPAVLAGMPEGVHQMRVAVRRLRAILSAFGKLLPSEQRRWASAELRWLADLLGVVRNFDVIEHGLLAPARAALADGAGAAALSTAVARRRRAALHRATTAIRSPRYTGALLRLLRWFDSCGWRDDNGANKLDRPIPDIAARILDRRQRVVHRHSREFAEQSPPERHRLRIALKKLRYSSELLAALYDATEVERFTRYLKRLQDDLGDANDLRVAREILGQIAKSIRHGADVSKAGKAALEWRAHRLARREGRIRDRLAELLHAPGFWAT